MKVPQHAFSILAFVFLWFAALYSPPAAYADTTQEYALDTLTLAQLRELRRGVLAKRSAVVDAAAEATDARIMQDVERALLADADLQFDRATRPDARAMREACATEDWAACLGLARLYEEGEGTRADVELAFAIEVAACFGRDPEACISVSWDGPTEAGWKRYTGRAPYTDVITEACEKGHANSCLRLSLAFENADGILPFDNVDASNMLERACKLGSDKACERLPKTLTEQAAQFASRCALGQYFSCALLGDRLIAGNGIKADAARGEGLIRESCDNGIKRACDWVIAKDALDTIGQANLLARGCEARPGRICNDAARLFENLPETPENSARIEQVKELACGAPDAYCLRGFWTQVAAAVAILDPFDATADGAFADAPAAQGLRENCAAAMYDACHRLARLYARDASRQRMLLAAKVLRHPCAMGDFASCLLIDDTMPLDTRTTRAVLKHACQTGSRIGCLRLTLADPDLKPAERLAPLQEACSDGEMVACRMQAELLADEAGRFEGGRDDRARAQALFLFTCESGDIEACFRYGRRLVEEAKGYTTDAVLLEKGLTYLDTACHADHAGACYQSGVQTDDLLGNDHARLNQTIRFYRRACTLDYRYCESLARVNLMKDRNALRRTHGVLASALMSHVADFDEDRQAAVRRYSRDCIDGDLGQCIALGDRYVDRLIVDGSYWLNATTPVDWAWAWALYEFACERENALGCERLAESYDWSGPRQNDPLAVTYAARGCELENAYSCHILASYHMNGNHMAVDLVAAERLFRRSCAFGYDFSCNQLADMEMWDGDPETKEERFLLACVHGNWFACGSLRDDLRALGWLKNRALIHELSLIDCEEGDEESCAAIGRKPEN